jgi:deoxyribodipyrimidine photo-lyase
MSVDDSRLRRLNDAPLRPERDYVLYWMSSARRMSYNFTLDRAVQWATELARPLVVLEALRCDYPWASDRLHVFVMQGMADNAASFASQRVLYYPFVEPSPGAGKGLLSALGARACVVVTDDSPAFFLPRALEAAGRQLDVRLDAIDTNGMVPLRATDRPYPTAYAFRRFVHGFIAEHGIVMPRRNPLGRRALPLLHELPSAVTRRWPPTDLLDDAAKAVSRLQIDHEVAPSGTRGGSSAARDRLGAFLAAGLETYDAARNDPDAEATSGLSPYLHFGHIASHQIVDRLVKSAEWSPDRVEPGARGSRAGWGGTAGARAFLDQLITWRELGFNTCVHREDYDAYESLPEWALKTLAHHATDRREHVYTMAELDTASTHDEVWNAAQRQLRTTGSLQNYMRMLWGKKILEWTESPRQALSIMIELNNRYALDGRDPSSYSGIFWTLGRHDRPWGPERPVFGKVRYMSSTNTRRKLKLERYLERYGSQRETA